MKNTDFTEQWTAMQKTFLPTSAISAPLRDNAQRFWENQDKVLDSMQARANAWFERRHTGTHKARVAAERMCETQTFVDLIQAYQEWASGAFERIMADGLTCQQQIMAITGALGYRHDLLLTRKSVGHDPLERSAGPFLNTPGSDGAKGTLCFAHTLCGLRALCDFRYGTIANQALATRSMLSKPCPGFSQKRFALSRSGADKVTETALLSWHPCSVEIQKTHRVHRAAWSNERRVVCRSGAAAAARWRVAPRVRDQDDLPRRGTPVRRDAGRLAGLSCRNARPFC